MKLLFKKMYAFVLQFCESIISILSVLLFSKKNVKSQFHHKINDDNSIFIFGNGGSLASFLDSIESIPGQIMVVNYFANTPYFENLKPKYYILLDNNLCINSEALSQTNQKLLIEKITSVDWQMNLLLPVDSNKELINRMKSVKNLNVILFNKTPVSGFVHLRNFLYDNLWGMPRPQNVLNAAIFCSIAMGFQKIYLYGAEHSWTKNFDVDPVNHRVYLNDGHFYERDNIEYLKRNEYCDWLLWIHYALKTHQELRRYADYLGVKIINKSNQSFVEAYDYE